jgi:hypothetical protein
MDLNFPPNDGVANLTPMARNLKISDEDFIRHCEEMTRQQLIMYRGMPQNKQKGLSSLTYEILPAGLEWLKRYVANQS